MNCDVCLSETATDTHLTLRLFGIGKDEIFNVVNTEHLTVQESLSGITLTFSSVDEFNRAKELLGDFVYSERGESMEEVVGKLLKSSSLSLSVAESCTAGLLSARIVNVPGSSEYFLGGVVVYSNSLKKKLLQVRDKTLENYGAVSRQTCMEMLEGLKGKFGTDTGIAITGIAGPGGTETKPEGLTYIGVYLKDKLLVEERIFSKGRNANRYLSTQVALNNLRKLILKEMS